MAAVRGAFSLCRWVLQPNIAFARKISSANDIVVIEKDVENGIATVYLNNPPVNQLDTPMLKSCNNALKIVGNDPDIRGVIVTSSFDGKVFSAGLNILDFYQKPKDHVVAFWSLVQDWHLSFYGLRKPTVMCLNGHSPAAGCALALMGDYRIMQKGANKMIGLNEVQLGIAPTYPIIDLMVRVIGRRKAEDALTLGRLFTAEQALEIGLVDELAELNDLKEKARTAVKRLMSTDGAAYGTTKTLIRHSNLKNLEMVRHAEAEEFAERLLLPETQRVIGKYLESLAKRK